MVRGNSLFAQGATMILAGFAQADITPREPVDLAGYFNRRTSAGVLDPLHARAAVFDDGTTRVALVVLDLIGLPLELVNALRERLGDALPHLLVVATHTHTAPAVFRIFDPEPQMDYVESVVFPGIEGACRAAAEALAPCSIVTGEAMEQGLAFNRRYWMRDGRVVTNPPKGHPDIVGPEGPVDHQVSVYAFESGGAVRGLLVDACNHTDTIGGSLVSADWPGHMARYVADDIGREVPVLLLNGPAGNINHFDPARPERQASYDESRRIGLGYAACVRTALARATALEASDLAAATLTLGVPYRSVTDEELAAARTVLEREVEERQGDLTAEDLAKGDPMVERIYAAQLLRFTELYGSRDTEAIEINAFRLGKAAFVGLPGEPFVEIGLAVKQRSPWPLTTVFALCNGVTGYVPLDEHFDHGGYEPRTTAYNRLDRSAGRTFIAQALLALESLPRA